MEWSGDYYNASVLYNNLFTAVMFIFILALPVFICSYYLYHSDELDDKLFIDRYGNIYDGLMLSKDKSKRYITLFYPLWFLLRRFVFSIVCVSAQEDHLLQIGTAMIFGLISISYLITYKPFCDRTINRLEIMNEIINLVLLYHVILFTGVVPWSASRYKFGWSYIFFMFSSLLVHLVVTFMETYRLIRLWYLRKYRTKIVPHNKKRKDLSII